MMMFLKNFQKIKEYFTDKPSFSFSVVLSLALFCFTYYLWSFYYVEYEGLVTSFISGTLTNGKPFRSIHFIGHIGTSYLYSYLYELFPAVEWLSWIYYSLLVISCSLGLYLVQCVLVNFKGLIKITLPLAAVYILVFADHNIHLIYTRVAYMLSGMSLISLIIFFPTVKAIKNNTWGFILLNIIFTIGCLTRLESATACFALCFFFSLFYYLSFKQILINQLYPFLIIISLMVWVSQTIKNSDKFYLQVEPDIEAQYIERENRIPLLFMKTQRDSVIYNMAEQMIWCDPSVISPEYLRSLIMPESILFTDIRQWKRVARNISNVAISNWQISLIALLMGILVYIHFNFNKSKRRFAFWIMFEFSFLFLLCLQTYVFKVNERSYSTLLSVFIFCHIVVLSKVYVGKHKKLSISLLLLMITVQISYLNTEAKSLKGNFTDYKLNLATINEMAGKQYLVLNSSSLDYLLLSNKPFDKFNFNNFKKIYITDGYIIPFLPYYKSYLESECNCVIEEFPSFWNYLKDRKKEVVIVSFPERIEAIQKYLSYIKNASVSFVQEPSIKLKKLKKTDSDDYYTDFGVYYIQ